MTAENVAHSSEMPPPAMVCGSTLRPISNFDLPEEWIHPVEALYD